MATAPEPKPSFSPWRKWSIGFNVFLIVFLVFAVVVMLNYLSRDYFLRFQADPRSRIQLSPRTISLLESLTNRVKVVVYYDREDPLFSSVFSLLNEYRLRNSRISVETIDYLRDPAGAQKVKSSYKLTSASDKNLVIFDCEGKRMKMVDGNALAEYTLEQVKGGEEQAMRRKPIAFRGEQIFTGTLLAVSSPKPLLACYLQGHGEHPLEGEARQGFGKFASVVKQNYVRIEPLSLLGTNGVPADCNLLIIAGPTISIPVPELEKINSYLNKGGKLFALLDAESIGKDTGVEKIVGAWGVAVGNVIIKDPDNSEQGEQGEDIVVSAFSSHPLVNPLLGTGIYLIRPRPVGRFTGHTPPADAPRVTELMFTGPKAHIAGSTNVALRQFPLAAAVEKGAMRLLSEPTRMVIVGESLFLTNGEIDSVGNRDFASYAVNWLLDRPELLVGIGQQPVAEYKLIMTRAQLQATEWLLLAGMPGCVLLLGVLVWWRRRR